MPHKTVQTVYSCPAWSQQLKHQHQQPCRLCALGLQLPGSRNNLAELSLRCGEAWERLGTPLLGLRSQVAQADHQQRSKETLPPSPFFSTAHRVSSSHNTALTSLRASAATASAVAAKTADTHYWKTGHLARHCPPDSPSAQMHFPTFSECGCAAEAD